MSKGDNSPGISRLAGLFTGMAKDAQPKDLVLDFGVIQGDGSLLTNTYPEPIPKSDYLICRHLKSKYRSHSTNSASVGDHGSHSHSSSVDIHEQVKKGDRVLVAWVLNDAVVVDVILQASSVL